ncbi:acylphosphatase [Acaryochloris marina]|uniref:Acylphosphatase n=1 Tax=Acaryochloris marina (strain MBIC 11017) TaxID=329726 RepID=ACYP_ACAM1|nr:acylphosphatase [Acaryochloris marina]B0C8Q6.1 RecName: Full=Acylphosphatase; AltName: Full=Acylphosphate phosphohydrolase [Acaryochloris marina MBIC11017]ABW31318.1 acylphosphatase [Acaryochloris marina MBIC11017]BDM79995.1 acylphosphatase [Acaryochloris marina MBIC10699]
MMPNIICLKAVISGKVQGVGYRYSTRAKAQSLGLVGWVRNLPDGRVEAMAEGERTQVDKLIEWFKQGPPAAEVSKVDVDEESLGEFRAFEILR